MKKMVSRSIKIVLSLLLCIAMLGLSTPMSAEAASKAKKSTDTTYLKQVFDADYYYNTYPDVASAIGKKSADLMNHYISFGMKEGRNASATFNLNVYRNNYSDLVSAFGDDYLLYFQHYISYGIKEGRTADPGSLTSVADNASPSSATTASGTATISGTVLSSYTTKYDAKIARATNVQLAASQINGKVVGVNETFSYLASLTPRTIENGYVVATIFSGGKKAKGIGGGICQVSSTLYAAVRGTSCEIVERHAHSLPVSYIPKGWDATVSSPNLDFRFKNTYGSNIVIGCTAENGVLTVTIYQQ